MREMSAILMSGPDDEVMDTHLSAVIGAAMVLGTREALAELRDAPDLPANPLRVADRDAAEAKNLPEDFCEWLLKGERGASSDFIAQCVTGIPSGAQANFPHDVGDFQRCQGVIKALRGVESEAGILSIMAQQSEKWRNLSENWSILKDMAGKSGSQCYTFMQSIFRKGGAND